LRYFCLLLGLIKVISKHALIEALDRGKWWTIAKQYVEEFQPLEIAAEHD
jgi:hypothetical protein